MSSLNIFRAIVRCKLFTAHYFKSSSSLTSIVSRLGDRVSDRRVPVSASVREAFLYTEGFVNHLHQTISAKDGRHVAFSQDKFIGCVLPTITARQIDMSDVMLHPKIIAVRVRTIGLIVTELGKEVRQLAR